MLSVLVFLLIPLLCNATITLTATGQHFASSPDEHVGTRFLQGFEYLARLQVFSQDLELCPDDSPHSHLNLTVDVPPDGLPVAVLARNTGCSVETKARLASYSVEPPHKLKYLILYGDEGLLPEEMSKLRHYKDRDLDITVGILHVSERSGNELLWSLTNQSPDSKAAGGPRLLLDGYNASRNRFARDFTLWMGIGVMMMACIFSFFLSLRAQQGAFASTPMQQAPARERPRRLTLEQVQELLPEYTASDLMRMDEESHQHSPEMCSICLDEYCPDDMVAELPCGHIFHCDCIAKWLTERSSTCPLCKTDLMPEEDDEDETSHYVELQEGGTQTDSDDSSVNRGIFSTMDRFFLSRPVHWWRRQQNGQESREQETNTDEEGVSQLPLLENDHGSELEHEG